VYRFMLAATLLGVLLGASLLAAPAARAVGVWTPTPPMPTPVQFQATGILLPSGQVLVAGVAPSGSAGESDHGSTEIYDSATDRWSARTPLSLAGGNTAPVLLPDGRVLFTGGSARNCSAADCMHILAAAQVYDSAADTWTPVAPLATARLSHTATLLQDGTVLVVGGQARPGIGGEIGTAERYDPRANRWSPAGRLAVSRAYHTATLLRDGRVLVVGGEAGDRLTATAEVYDPRANAWSAAGSLSTARESHTATLLRDGRVLVAGGSWAVGSITGSELASAELYDPATNRWSPARPMRGSRGWHTATLLRDGQVLVTGGGFCCSTPAVSTEIYDPAQDAWASAAPMTVPRSGHTAALLSDGRVLVAGGVGLDGMGTAEVYTPNPGPEACFPETGKCVGGAFLAYWQAHGGLAVNGYPLSDEFIQVLEDGKAYQVQYFERVRMEYHPENQPPYDVLLGQFGRRVLRESENPSPPDTAPATPIAGQAYFTETGHNLGGGFLDYWQSNGGLAQFGFPLTEVVTESLMGRTYQVQYFERARMEYHPENQAPYDIELGQFGRRILAESDALAGERSFALLYLMNEHVQALLGPPAASGNHPPGAYQAPGAFQPFEHGAMIYQGDIRGIYVLCGDEQAGRTLVPQRSRPTFWGFDDTWDPTQPIGGGPGPQPGLYEPARGFGKVWRENQAVRDCLGYATTPDETTYTIVSQQFLRGVLLTATTPTGQFVYVLYGGQPGAGGPFYERHIDPAP
jgi:N-acetylneuraminic acid mutarotase